MKVTKKALREKNSIAYDDRIREISEIAHEILGTDITDIYQAAWEESESKVENISMILKKFSEITADFTEAIVNARKSKKTLSVEEEELFNEAQKITGELAEIQDYINKILKNIKERAKEAKEISGISDILVQKIMDTQDLFRNFRIQSNNYGFLSEDPKIADLYREDKN